MYKREFQRPHRKKVPNTHKDKGTTNSRRNGGKDQKLYSKTNFGKDKRGKAKTHTHTHTHTHTEKEMNENKNGLV